MEHLLGTSALVTGDDMLIDMKKRVLGFQTNREGFLLLLMFFCYRPVRMNYGRWVATGVAVFK